MKLFIGENLSKLLDACAPVTAVRCTDQGIGQRIRLMDKKA
jgi:hypothetical protein